VGVSLSVRSISSAAHRSTSYVAIVQLQLAFSSKARLGASACAFYIGYLLRVTEFINLS